MTIDKLSKDQKRWHQRKTLRCNERQTSSQKFRKGEEKSLQVHWARKDDENPLREGKKKK